MSVKNRTDLIAEIVAQITANGTQAITGPIVNQLLQDLADSNVNMLGDTAIQGKLAYNSLIALSNPGDIVYKKWVEDLVAGLGGGDFLADGSIPMTGDLDMSGNDILDVATIKDSSDVTSIAPNTRLLKDSLGNTIVSWLSRVNGFGINTNSWTGFLKTTNLTTTNRAIELPDADCTLASTDDVAASLVSAQTYADNLALGLKWKAPVVVATTENITLSGEQTIDGILTSASRVLVKNQSAATDNGIYVSGAEAWSRSTDANSAAELEGAAVIVQKGTVGANLGYTQTADDIVLGVTNLSFAQFAGSTASFASLTGAYSDNTSLNNKIVAMDLVDAGKQTAFTAQTANLIYSGPGSGASALPTFRSMVNADLPSGTPKLLPEVGTIITENWANLSAWTKVGGQTFTVGSGSLSVVGATPGSPTFTNYYTNTGYGNTGYMHWTSTFNITVGTISATSWGVAFGIQSQNSYFPSSPHIGVMLDSTNKGNIFLYANNTNTILKQTNKPLPAVTAGDVLTVTISRVYDQIQATVTNTSVTPNTSVTLIYSRHENSTTSFIPNIGQFAFYALGGTHTVSPLTVTIHQKIGSDLLLVADSRGVGASATNYSNSLGGLLRGMYSGVVDNYAGVGNRNQDFVAAELLVLAPKHVLLFSGTNNQADGDSAATTATKLQTLVTSLTGYTLGAATNGIWYLDELPKTSADMSGYSSAYKTTLGITGCIQVFQTFLAASGTGQYAEWFSTDNLHPNNIGHQYLADVVANQFTAIPKANISLPYQSAAYLQNGKLVLGNDYVAPNHILEVIDQTGISQVRIGNSKTREGGFVGSNSSNNLALTAGYYKNTSGQNIATETKGSGISQNLGVTTFGYFSSATIGSLATVNVSGVIDNSGRWITGTTQSATFQSTNGGGAIAAHFMIDPASSLSSGISYSFNIANGFSFNQGNGTKRVAFASILPVSTNATAGSEAGDITFLTQSGGTAASEKLRITGAGALTLAESVNFIFGTTTGTKHGTATTQKQSFWNATPIVQPATGGAASTFVANTSAIANDTATFDGYTIGQVVKALRNMGLLA